MKKYFILFSVLFLVLIATASAARYEDNYFKYGIVTADGLTVTSTPVDNVSIIGFICSNAACSSVSGRLWPGVLNSGDDYIQLVYPSVLQSPYGYGVYMYKKGYIPYEVWADWWGTCSSCDPVGPYDNYLTKKDFCKAEIKNFSAVDPNNIINVSVDVESPMHGGTGPLEYLPPELEQYYGADVDVILEAYKGTTLYYTETKKVHILTSQIKNIKFSFTANQSGDYKIVVKTNLQNESKCLTYQESVVQTNVTKPACTQNSDCGTDDWVNGNLCQTDDVFRNYITYTCNNPGQANSYCSNVTDLRFVLDCGVDGCGNYNNNYCKSEDVYKNRTCNDKGCSNGTCFNNSYQEEVLVQDCGEDYCTPFGNNYCKNNDLYKNKTCHDKGCATGSCFDTSTITETFVQDCGEDYCENYTANYCEAGDVYKNRTCHDKGCSNNGCFDTTNNEKVLVQDCGNEYYSENYCMNKSVVRDHFIPKCTSGVCGFDKITEVVEECSDVCSNGTCVDIVCYVNSDCGTDQCAGLPNYCMNDDVYQDFLRFTCNLPGTPQSFCSNSTLPMFLEDCGVDGCGNYGNNYCKNNDLYKSRTCYDKGCALGACFNNPFNEEILVQDCGEDYCDAYGQNYCKGNDVYKKRTCYDKGCNSNGCYSNSYEEEVLVQDCVDTCSNGQCVNITCHTNTDCGTDGWVNGNICSSDDVFRNYITYTCNNANTPSSYCTNVIDLRFIQDCGIDGCGSYSNNYCKSGDVYKNRTCHDRGCTSGNCFDNTNNEEVLVQDCGNEYYSDNYCVGNTVKRKHFLPKCTNGVCGYDEVTEVVEQCSDVCSNGTCVDIVCYANSDCGTDQCTGLPNYCMNDDVYQDFLRFTCNYPGQTNSFCSNNTFPMMLEDCGTDYCDAYGQNYCKNGEVYKKRTCYDNGCALGACFSNSHEEEILVQDCVDACSNGQCTTITCHTNSDCGIDSWIGNNICQTDDVFRNYLTYTCNNAGQTNSYCTNNTELRFVLDCGANYCGAYTGNYCENGSVYRKRTCHDKGCALGNCFDNSREEKVLVSACQYGCTNGACNGQPVCFVNTDCGIDECAGGPNYCENNDVYQVFLMFSCNNPGLFNAFCSNTTIPMELEDCGEDYCDAYGQNYCKNNSVYKSRKCYDKGCSSGSCFITNSTEEVLVQSCSQGCNNGACIMQCTTNSQCENDYYSDNYCYNNTLSKDFHDFSCLNNGCAHNITRILVQSCQYGCNNSQCNTAPQEPECSIDSDCGQEDSELVCIGDFVKRKTTIPKCSNSTCSDDIYYETIEECDEDCDDGECVDYRDNNSHDNGNNGATVIHDNNIDKGPAINYTFYEEQVQKLGAYNGKSEIKRNYDSWWILLVFLGIAVLILIILLIVIKI